MYHSITSAREIAFIDPAISNLERFLAGLRVGVEPVLLDATIPALVQIASALRHRSGLDAVHIVAHGHPGEIRFASGALSAETVGLYAAELEIRWWRARPYRRIVSLELPYWRR